MQWILAGWILILLTDKGLTMKYIIYSISKTNILIYKFGFSGAVVAANQNKGTLKFKNILQEVLK